MTNTSDFGDASVEKLREKLRVAARTAIDAYQAVDCQHKVNKLLAKNKIYLEHKIKELEKNSNRYLAMKDLGLKKSGLKYSEYMNMGDEYDTFVDNIIVYPYEQSKLKEQDNA